MSAVDSPIRILKTSLRQTISAAVKEMTVTRQQEDSRRICGALRGWTVFQNARIVLFYAPMPGEVDLWPLLKEALAQGKQVGLPSYDRERREYRARRVDDLERDLQTGLMGIREPASHCASMALKSLDLALVPGVGFAPSGRRLGRGKGFYDRLLSAAGGIRCGIGWDEQICLEIPLEPHDVVLECILTPSRWHFASPGKV